MPFVFSQNIDLYDQISGRVDFTMIGNTLNTEENGLNVSCSILTSSTANLNLDTNNVVEKAFLYWSGSGNGDFEIKLNNQNITAERTFSLISGQQLSYFSAFADITNLVQTTGNSDYTLSDLDLTNVIGDYCDNATNFGGWAIIIVFSNESFSINQVNIYDGLESISGDNPNITIQLNDLNVLDNTDAKVGFLAWEGDSGIAVNESLRINGNLISNPPLNPATNVFNGTNSFTGATDLFNMDLDFYNIEDYINIGDTSATVELTSMQDFVMLNSVIVKLNLQLPDAIVEINSFQLLNCNSREVAIDFTVFNTGAEGFLPENTPVSLFANDTLVTTFFTQNQLLPNQSENFSEIINIPNNIPEDFILHIIVDDDGNGNSTVFETNELNNEDEVSILLFEIPIANAVPNLEVCDDLPNTSDGIAAFNTSEIESILLGEQTNRTIFYFDALGNSLSSPLPNPFITSSQNISVLIESTINSECTATTTIQFNVMPLPEFDIFNNLICLNFLPEPLIVTIENAQETYNYEWHNSNGEIIGDTLNQLEIFEDGIYSVTATTQDDLACTTTKFFTITETSVAFNQPTNLLECDEGLDTAIFNLDETLDQITIDFSLDISFFTSEEDLVLFNNEIIFTTEYTNTSDPQTIFARIENPITNCYGITTFLLETEDCFPIIPNAFTPNGDAFNPTYTINGLHDIFLDFEIQIYNRYGNLIYEGNNNKTDWDGTYKGEELPTGTYFYFLKFNDEEKLYTPIDGWIYLNR